MAWRRVLASEKLAFREDLQADPTLTDLQKRMISVIAQHWNNERMTAECSESFIARGSGTTAKMVKRYKASLADSGRVSIKRAATYTESTLWDVNWAFRGSAWVRLNNDGQPRTCGVVPTATEGVVPDNAHEVVPKTAEGWSLGLQGGGPQAGTQFPSKEGDRGAPEGARPYEAAQGAPEEKKKENPHKAQPGFAKWKIVHAEYEGEEEDILVAHLRSGKSRKYVVRCHVDSDDYESLDNALTIDGEPRYIIGEMVQMSTNKAGTKLFMRAAPLPWRDVTILNGESFDDGTANIRVRFDDEGGYEHSMTFSAGDAAGLIEVCGGEEEAIGSSVRWRVMPDDSMEFRKKEPPAEVA